MRAMILEEQRKPLLPAEWPTPRPGFGEVLLAVKACAVCRTDLHVIDGDLPNPKLPLIPGHEIVATVVEVGNGVESLSAGDRVGVPWLGSTCGRCEYCVSDRENLCNQAAFTGYTRDGGYAEFTVALESFCIPVPNLFTDVEAAPLLCAGLIGYRSLMKTGNSRRVGIYGYGAAAHIVSQVAAYQGRRVYAFTRPRDAETQGFARELGAVWAGGSDDFPPEELDAAIIFAPAGELVPMALRATRKGGVVVCGGIHMSDIPSFPYSVLWGERSVCSVANLTRRDGHEFMALAATIPIRPAAEPFGLNEANIALQRLRSGQLRGAAVLVI